MDSNELTKRSETGCQSTKSGRSPDLEEELTIVQFSKIMDKFEEIGQQDSQYQRSPEVSTHEFCVILAEVFGKSPEDRKVKSLCNKIDAEGLGFIRAEEFCSYIIQKLKEKDTLSQNLSLPFNDPPRLRHTILCKETICRLNPCFNPTRYISVSKNGLLGVWSSQLNYQHSKNLLDGWSGGRVKVTDCLTMGNCNKLVLSLSSRELSFFDTVDSFKCKYKLHDLPCIPLCMDYYFNPKLPKSKSYLLFGDDSGSVSILTFMNPSYGLFSAPSKDDENKIQLVAHVHIPSNGKFVSLQSVPHLHEDWINGIWYIPHNHTFISSTNSPVNSLTIRDINHGTNNYVFKLRKGVQCFDYSRSADLLVTGSIDHFVRVFNPFVPAKPVATLIGHDTTVVGIAIAAESKIIFSLGRNLMVCAWDLREHVLLQTITIKLPFIQRLPDFGGKPLIVLPSAESLVVISNEYTAELKLGLIMGGEEDGDLFVSHKYPLCAALYNRHFNQVVSGCEGGVVNIWDVGSGALMVRLTDCHGKNEITAMNLDKMGRLLMTGSRAGDIKVWQYIGSTCIKHMQKNEYTEVTGIMHVPEKRVFISVGWDKKITAFKDDPDVYAAVPNENWKRESTYHNDDILCAAYCPPHYLATGSFDGEIKVWNVDLERVVVQYNSICRIKPHILQQLKKSIGISKRSADLIKMSPLSTASSSRPVSRRLASRQRRLQSMSGSQIQHVPVDQLLFLQSRMRAKVKGAGIMVSSEAGMANFWDLFGKTNPVGSFALTENEAENVLAMATDTMESHLLAGDTLGCISIFYIQDYCSTGERGDKLEPIARWKAHIGEIVNIDYVPHRTQPLVLSASGDGTVRLWTLMGHFIGTFGQDKPWDLNCTATFQHPKTPWGDMWKSDMNVSTSSFKSSSHLSNSSQLALGKKSLQTPQPLKEVPEQVLDVLNGDSSAHSSVFQLPSPVKDEQLSGDSRLDKTKKNKGDGKDRKAMLTSMSKAMADKLDSHAPFHALQLSKMEDIKIPKDISVALKNPSS